MPKGWDTESGSATVARGLAATPVGNDARMANVLEATVDAVKGTSGEVASVARHGVEALGDQVATLASKVTDLFEPEPKHSSKGWWWSGLLLVIVALAFVWWRKTTAERPDEERTDATGVPRQPIRSTA
jgi:hypothetical protein